MEEITMAEEKKKDRSEYMRQYYQKNREKLLAEHNRWGKENRERNTENRRKARERQKRAANPGDILDALDAIQKE